MSTIEDQPQVATAIQHDYSKRMMVFGGRSSMDLAAKVAGKLELGIEQRVRALNAFLYDIYHRQEILKAGKVPEELVIQNAAFLPEMIGVEP